MTDDLIEAVARAILLVDTEDNMGLLCDQITEWEAHYAARAAIRAAAPLILDMAAEYICPPLSMVTTAQREAAFHIRQLKERFQ